MCGSSGSPPRMRGKEIDKAIVHYRIWITPAYAGKRSIIGGRCDMVKDHPRVCGEKLAFLVVRGREMGSPPRMRGKDAHPPRSSGPGGITPAYAGKSSTRKWREERARDHPRVCGEKLRKTAVSVRELGSPPRMRGKGAIAPPLSFPKRITPAYAGKSPAVPRYWPAVQDHPRVCGEKKSWPCVV